MNGAQRARVAVLLPLAFFAAGSDLTQAAPATAQRIAIQGVARDAGGQPIPAGDVAIRLYADSLGGAPLYDSATEFAGAIVQGIFDVVAGAGAPVSLDPDQAAFLELDVAGSEVIGDGAGGRWRFYPGGGSRARPDLEARLDALEAAVELSPFAGARRPARAQPVAHARRDITPSAGRAATLQPGVDGGPGGVHGILGVGRVAGQSASLDIEGHLIVQPVGVRAQGGVVAELGPYYLYAPQPPPAIRFVRDVPNDQGRAVRVRWRRDLRERPYTPADPLPLVTGYTLYRRVEPGQSATAPETGAPAASAGRDAQAGHLAARAPGNSAGGTVSHDGLDPNTVDLPLPERHAQFADAAATLALPPGEWDVLGTFPATLDTAYQTVVPTLCDSTDAGLCWSVFAVRAITNQVGTFYDSFADSGYSIDNLAPAVPAGFALQPVAGGTALSWQPSDAPDFGYYRVYRDLDPEFTPDASTLVHATIETGWTDAVTGSFTYKLTAVDLNGNESPAASASITTGVESAAPSALAFALLGPNPFRDRLQLTVEVPEAAGVVEVAVFDVTGRRVRMLARQALSAGRHAFAWDGRSDSGARAAAGVYVLRLSGAGRVLTKRTALLP